MRVFAISGSLRAASLNSMLLRSLARIAPASVRIELFREIGQLPLFNPDLEASDPAVVADLRRRIIGSDAVVIASPEYAHGISSVIKNALDWMVSNESFVGKPVALFNASPRASHALAALRETLRTMSARIVDAACITVPLLGSGMSENQIIEDRGMRGALLRALHELAESVSSADGRSGPSFSID